MNKQKVKVFEKMELKDLTEYIEQTHHVYELSSLSAIENYFNNISDKDLELNPNLPEIKSIFIKLMNTFHYHVNREEKFINHLIELAKESKVSRNGLLKDIDGFKNEHNGIYKSLQKIKEFTNNFKVDENSSAVLKLCCARLFDFEQDFLKHQYLEEQYLFPQLIQRLTVSG